MTTTSPVAIDPPAPVSTVTTARPEPTTIRVAPPPSTTTTFPEPTFDRSGPAYDLSPEEASPGMVLVGIGEGCVGERRMLVGLVIRDANGINIYGSQPGEPSAPDPTGRWRSELRVPSGLGVEPVRYWVSAECHEEPVGGSNGGGWDLVQRYQAEPFIYRGS